MDENDMITSFGFSTKDEMLDNLRAYLENPDDDTIRVKNKIKEKLINSPKLLWALNNEELEGQLFDDDGNLDPDGEWDAYFGTSSCIRPFLSIPQTQDTVSNYICYQVSTDENMRYNPQMKYFVITFTIFVHEKNSEVEEVGVPRHDLLGAIIRELMAWSSVMAARAVPVYEGEATTDNNYITKVIKYQASIPNNISMTINGESEYVNKSKV